MSNYTEVVDTLCIDRLELLDNQCFTEFIEEIPLPEMAIEMEIERQIEMEIELEIELGNRTGK